jgi:hypothetical protein
MTLSVVLQVREPVRIWLSAIDSEAGRMQSFQQESARRLVDLELLSAANLWWPENLRVVLMALRRQTLAARSTVMKRDSNHAALGRQNRINEGVATTTTDRQRLSHFCRGG